MYARAKSYLVNISIIEGRHLAWPDMDSAVLVRVDNQKRCTKIARSTDCPYFNEYFAFEFHARHEELLDKNITLTVIKPKTMCGKKKILGYVALDVATVWDQDDHQFYHKWAVIMAPTDDSAAGPRGYLKVDISVLAKGESPKIPSGVQNDNDEIEGNILLPVGVTTERVRADYIFKIYRGENIAKLKSPKGHLDKSPPNSLVEISFVGLKGRTSVRKGTAFPVWNERITMTELFPPLCRRIKIEMIHSDPFHRTTCAARYVNLHDISNDGEHGFLPTFGPSFVHFYNRGAYFGQVLLCVRTELRDSVTVSKDVVLEPIPASNEASYFDGCKLCDSNQLALAIADHIPYLQRRIEWAGSPHQPPAYSQNSRNVTNKSLERIDNYFQLTLLRYDNVLLFATIFEVTAIHKKYSDKPISFEIGFGPSANKGDAALSGEGDAAMTSCTVPAMPYTHDMCTWYLEYENEKPCLYVCSLWPDFRRRMYNANMVDKILIEMETNLNHINEMLDDELHRSSSEEIGAAMTHMLDQLASGCRKYIDISSSTSDFGNDLDRERMKFCRQEMEEIEALSKTIYNPKAKKKSLRKSRKLHDRLKMLTEEPQSCWPDVIITMFYGSKPLAYHQLPCRQIVFSIVQEESGIHCGTLEDIFVKLGTKEGIYSDQNTVCRLNIRLWVGLERHKEQCFNSLPPSFKSPSDPIRGVLPSFLVTEEYNVFQCRAHIYQARISPGADESGLCDAFVRVLLGEHCRITQVKKATLNPVWDQTLVFSDITIHGSREFIKRHPPSAILIVMDQDECWKTECVGRAVVKPLIKFAGESYTSPTYPPKLDWAKFYNDGESLGDILAAVELLQKSGLTDEDDDEKHDSEIISIAADIKPKLEQYRVEVVFWGVRDLRKIHLLPITKPKIKLEICGESLQSEPISSTKKTLNFCDPIKYLDVNLPSQEQYAPPLCLKMFDCRSFGRSTYAGTSIASVQTCMFHPLLAEERSRKLAGFDLQSTETFDSVESNMMLIAMQQKKQQSEVAEVKQVKQQKVKRSFWGGCCKSSSVEESASDESVVGSREDKEDENFDWWTKYHASLELHSNETNPSGIRTPETPRIKIYNSELESQPEFGKFSDVLRSFPMYKGKRTGDETVDEENTTGTFKGAIRIYRSPLTTNLNYVTCSGRSVREGVFQDFPGNEHLRYTVRVYCVKGINLRPKDASGKSDPYVRVSMNGHVISDRANYVPCQVNPIFGRCFELEGVFPMDHTIKVAVWDWDMTSSDDLIGETTIDLENRIFTNHRAGCGLASEYRESGYCAWRDQYPPTRILDTLCKKYNLPAPEYTGTSVKVTYREFLASDASGDANHDAEVLALAALRRWQHIPVVGCHLVPEHVETRSLYHPSKPGIEQGKLQLWIDIFPVTDLPTPKPVDIAPRKPVSYELRVIVWNTENVILQEKDLFLGEQVSDIYVKGWMTGPDQSQCTDVHYRSLTGEGNFNWRFVFRFDYLATENKLVLKRKSHVFDLDETEIKMPCKLTLQVWDNDTFSPDDFLGVLHLELARIPKGARHSKYCSLKIFGGGAPTINLFKIKRTKGWWPFLGKEKDKSILAGKVEVEMELLSADEADRNPVGLGRNDPHALPKPKRPDTSFSWLRNPLKALTYTACKLHRTKIIVTLIVVLLGLMAALAIYAFPGYTVKKLLHA